MTKHMEQGCEFDDMKPGPSRDEIQAALDDLSGQDRHVFVNSFAEEYLDDVWIRKSTFNTICTVLTQALERVK
jgi:hypothetical protein